MVYGWIFILLWLALVHLLLAASVCFCFLLLYFGILGGMVSPGCNTSEKGMMSCGSYRAKDVGLRRDGGVTEGR